MILVSRLRLLDADRAYHVAEPHEVRDLVADIKQVWFKLRRR